jgi:hypothetical protein
MSLRDAPSKRAQIRDLAAQILGSAEMPMHYRTLANEILPKLGLVGVEPARTVNKSLHEDPKRRFLRVGSGTWSLSPRDPSE